MKVIAAIAATLFSTGFLAEAAILFSYSNGPGTAVKLTITEEIRIPVTGNEVSFGVLLNIPNVYASPQAMLIDYPQTVYGAANSVLAALETGDGPTIPAVGYDYWGAPGVNGSGGSVGPRDFLIQFQINSGRSAGDVFVIESGEMILHPSVPLPDLEAVSIYLLNSDGTPGSPLIAVPEPATITLATIAGMAAALRRRR